jgi:hypothetical protein
MVDGDARAMKPDELDGENPQGKRHPNNAWWNERGTQGFADNQVGRIQQERARHGARGPDGRCGEACHTIGRTELPHALNSRLLN